MNQIGYEVIENRRIKDVTSEGKIAVQYCGGQTCIWVPFEYGHQLGPEKILSAIESVFAQEELENSRGYAVNELRRGRLAIESPERNGYEIELPSLTHRADGFRIDPEGKIPKLVGLINQKLMEIK